MKRLGLPLAIVGLFAIMSMGLILFLIEEDIRLSTLMYEEELRRLNALVGPRDGIRAAYQEYHSLLPDEVKVYVQSLENGALSDWKEGKNHSFVVRELRLGYFDGRVRFATLSEISPSTDWSQDTNYYFRSDGSLAMLVGDLNTFYGNVTVHKERLYGSNGKAIERRLEVLDIESGLPVDRPFYQVPVIEYKTVAQIHHELKGSSDIVS